jgi:osmoprotectant transport system permease protein
MTTEAMGVEKRSDFWRDLIDGWTLAITRPDLEAYRKQKARADPLATVIGVGLLGLVIGLLALMIRPPFLVTGDEPPLVTLLRVIFFTEADFFVLSLILFFVAKSLGGRGSFTEQSYLLSLLAVPLGSIIVAFLFTSNRLGIALTTILNPLSPVYVVTIFILLIAFYGFLLLLFALNAAHDMPASSILYTVGAPVLIWGVLRVASMFAAGEENLITIEWRFIADQWAAGTLQELLLGHFWLVLFSVLVAIVVGVVIGVLITWPPRRPRPSHAVLLVPLVIFFILWGTSSGMFSAQLGDTIMDTVRTWDRSLGRVEGFFGPLMDILAAIVSKPAAIGAIGVLVTLIFYALLIAGERASELTLYIAGIILTIPSVALFGVMIRPLGIGPFNAAFALILYAQLPILRNTYTGIKEVAAEIVEAGRGMGMTEMQLLTRVKLPMSIPVIMTGVRVSIVMLVGIAAIAAYIGNDTLGDYIFAGIQRAQEKRYIAGAILIAVLALAVDYFMGWLQNRLTPEGLKGRRAG